MMGKDPFSGAVPIGNGEVSSTNVPNVVTCIWHSRGMDHPPDAPGCENIMHNGRQVQAMPMGSLIAWLTVNLTQMLAITNGMAEHLNELQVYVESLDATLEEGAGKD